MTISGLHITISSLFSLVTFNPYRSFLATTRGLPAFNGTASIEPFTDSFTPGPYAEMQIYAAGSLYFLPSVLDDTTSTSLGLQDGSLYDVLDINAVVGNATVNASGFNITCGSVPMDRFSYDSNSDSWTNSNYRIHSTQVGIISSLVSASPDSGSESELPYDSLLLYSTIPIVDSSGKSGSWIEVSPPMNSTVSSVQMLQCSLTLVRQLATVDAQSGIAQTIGPSFRKNTSTWLPYTAPRSNVTTDGNLLIDTWATWYGSMPSSDFFLDNSFDSDSTIMATVADVYLIQRLNLPAYNHSDTQNVTLHDLENALSTLVASMFWTLGHIPPTHRPPTDTAYGIFVNGTVSPSLSDIPTPPMLLPGNSEVREIFAEARVELSASLAASVILMMLAMASLRSPNEDDDLPLDGTGILHAIWLYRNHPELEARLEQVEHPTDENLRAAGMVKTRLVGKRVRKDELGY
ncbi:hypothetical protein GGX14DRAFT_417491 [Mycena pura]|uniref:Uncharacterized protein n=1 Tax=Mycena pura TaxID=153505 RepID=A0AAD6YQT2_9AGAR|nr:hypothetical protein GGX14DRAFT_417491 [Mycena pura]